MPWQSDNIGWWWRNDNGSYPTNTWLWLDGNQDGVFECCYFGPNGYMLANTTTPDGYTVNSDGAWTENGTVQTKTSVPASTSSYNANYDPARPLAGKIDEWNLRLPRTTITGFDICTESLRALLTNQMDYYNYLDVANYAPLVDGMYVAERNGTTFYITEENYNEGKRQDQLLYDWFCNWLSGMDFENMSEMERAKEIQKVLASASYEYGNELGRNAYIQVLINKKAYCGEYAMTACTLAKALGILGLLISFGGFVVALLTFLDKRKRK